MWVVGEGKVTEGCGVKAMSEPTFVLIFGAPSPQFLANRKFGKFPPAECTTLSFFAHAKAQMENYLRRDSPIGIAQIPKPPHALPSLAVFANGYSGNYALPRISVNYGEEQEQGLNFGSQGGMERCDRRT